MRFPSPRLASVAASKLSAGRKARKRFRSARLERLEVRLAFSVHDWTGLGADNLWSNSLNWTNGSPSSDGSGDVDLVFHTNLVNAPNLVTQNDLTNLVVDTITFDSNSATVGATTYATGGSSTDGYTINGNTITIDTGAPGQDPFGINLALGVADPANGITETFNAGLTLANTDATFIAQQPGERMTFTGDLDLGTRTLTINNTTGGANNAAIQGVVISGAISNGNLAKTGSGTLDLTGNNTFTNLTANGGFILADTDTALGDTVGTITVNDPAQIQLRNGVTVVKAALNDNSNSSGGGLGANGNTTNTFRGFVNLFAGNGGVALGAGNGSGNANTRLVVDGIVTGATSTLFMNGSGVIEFTKNNFYTGITDINGNQGFTTVQVDAPGGLGAGGGGGNRTIIENGGVGGNQGGTVLLNFNGTLQDSGSVPEFIDFAGSGRGGLGAVRTLGNANVVIPGNITFIAAAPWTFGVDGALGSITTTGVIDSVGANRALTKVGAGTLVIAGNAPNTYLGGTNINGGVISVTNTSASPLGPTASVTVNTGGTLRLETGIIIPNAVVLTGGTLAGSGIVNNTVTSIGGTISPGASTAVLTANNNVFLDSASTFRAEINGTTPGTGFDRLNVNGTVTLGGATLNASLGFTPAVGNTFVLIVNDGTDPVSGTFAGLPEGATFQIGGSFFTISYAGGGGNNDVVLTTVASPPPPTPPTLSISDVSLTEGNGGTKLFSFTVTRSGSLAATSDVTVATADDSATVADNDYVALAPSPVHFAIGQSTAFVNISVNGDLTVEPDETFFVNLTAPIGATISDSQGVGTIINDDAAAAGSAVVATDPADASKTALIVTGTTANDKIEFTRGAGGVGVKVKLNGKDLGTFSFTGAIYAFGAEGNDTISVDHAITTSAFLFGQAGDDVLNAGAGDDVLVGDTGKDKLQGYDGRDLLIGGSEADNLEGNNGEDIQIGGSTVYDANPAQLATLMKEWTRTDQVYLTRVNNLRNGGGLNGTTKLDDPSLIADSAIDDLKGNNDSDLFFANTIGGSAFKDKLSDRKPDEVVFQLG